MLIASVIVGVLIVVVVAMNQLGGKVSGALKDPGITYAASLADGEALGNPTAPVTVEVYGDFQCPYCAIYSLSVEPIIVNDYVNSGQVRIVHHEFVWIDRTSNGESRLTATGAYCAAEQGKYWAYSHWVYNNQDGENLGAFSRDRLTSIAAAAGLDTAAWSKCLDTPAAAAYVQQATAKANSIPITGTPTIFVNGTPWQGTSLIASSIEDLIRTELAKASASPAASSSPAASGSTAP